MTGFFAGLPLTLYTLSLRRATANLKLNLTLVQQLGDMWGASAITDAMYCLLKSDTYANANANELVGNRMFWSNDYMVRLFTASGIEALLTNPFCPVRFQGSSRE